MDHASPCDYDSFQQAARSKAQYNSYNAANDLMCGITGFWRAKASASEPELHATVERMASTLVHRGPDDAGVWCDPLVGVALGFRRLAIIDLSEAGHQPMASRSGRYVVVFNGEIYNFQDIRRELAELGVDQFRGHSDTEVLLAAIEHWGLESALRRCVGMFAIALWDRDERALHLVRDRLGVKPLYFGKCGGAFLFGSELKALRAYPRFDARIDRTALTEYLRYGYVPGPRSIYEGFQKVVPGTIVTIEGEMGHRVRTRVYWSARQVALDGIRQPFEATEAELTEALDKSLREAVGLRLIADVPLGVFLSGGVDSSTVAAVAQALSSRPIRTFSIGFSEQDYDEAPHARAVAQHLGTEHTELYVTARDALDVVPRLPELYDEPFGGSSQIPTYLVSAMARRHVTVCLSGDGGDELFAGYNRYNYAEDIWRMVSRVPLPVRRLLSGALGRVRPALWETVYRPLRPHLPKRLQLEQPADKFEKARGMLALASQDEVYRHLVSLSRSPSSVVVSGNESLQHVDVPEISSTTLRMMYLDLVTYLPDDILVKVDRASMGVSLEAREPLLDHRLVEFAWRLPLAMKSRQGTGKWLLRAVLDKYVPRTLIERPKIGFGVPIHAWLRGPLREWAEELLAPARLDAAGYLRSAPIRERWHSHLAGRSNEQHFLWNVLMFQSWLSRQATPS